jgi:hypothetical protein
VGDYYLFLVTGIILLSVMIWEIQKNKINIAEAEKRLEEKEKRLYEMYQAFEDIIQYTLSEAEERKTDNNPAIATRDVRLNNTVPLDKPSPDEQTGMETVYPEYTNKRKAVRLMHEGGNTEEEIARKLGIGIGEVRLILGLKR